MRSQINQVDIDDSGIIPEPEFIRVKIPKGFHGMDLGGRIDHVANELKSLEAEYPFERGTLIRHTALVRIERDALLYRVDYVAVLDDEY